MVGRPPPVPHFRRGNLIGALIVLLAAVLPALAMPAWRKRPVRNLVLIVGWIALVGYYTRAVTLEVLRVARG